MKKTIFKLFLLILVVIMIFSFTACDRNAGGNNGKSAYQIWLDDGHTGTEADFLNWLKGASGNDGQSGENGSSAYQIWLEEGHSGTETDFFNWLKNEAQGEQGLSAYDLFKLQNLDYEGTEEEWLNDLANGKFAKYTITFNSNGGTSVDPTINIFRGSKISAPTAIYKTNYIFAGWFKERELISKWDFNIDIVLSDTVLYAKWVESAEPLIFTPISGTTNCSVSSNWKLADINELETIVVPQTALISGVEYTATKIDSDAFNSLYNLKVLILPETITEIEDWAFWGCYNLRTIYMPKVESIGEYVFGYCSKLENIFLPASLTSAGRFMFSYYDYERDYPLNIHIAGTEFLAAGWIQNLDVGPNSNIIYNSTYTNADNLTFLNISSNQCGVSIYGNARTTLEKLYLPPVWNGRLLTQIAAAGFSDCLNLNEVILPATVRSINPAAFYNCGKLEKIALSDVQNIGGNALALCHNLKEIVIPLSVKQVGEGVLAISSVLRTNDLTVYVDAGYDTVQTLLWSPNWLNNSGSNISVIYGWLTPAKVSFDTNGGNIFFSINIKKGQPIASLATPYMDNYTFAGWFKDEQLTTSWDIKTDIVTKDIILHASWTAGEAATAGLSYTPINNNTEYKVSTGTAALTGRLVIPAEYDGKPVTAIDVRAFANLSTLGLTSQITSVNLPDTIKDLGTQSFYGCTLLTTVTIPAGVTAIDSAFDNCSGITTIKVSEKHTALYVENNCVIRKSDNVLIFSCRTGIIPDSVKGIGDGAFSGCEWLTDITIPYGVEFIGEAAFSQCDNLRTVIIPDSVQSIGEFAFWNCLRLTNINIPYGITKIADYVFDGCYWLTSIIIPDSVEYFGYFAFADTDLTSIVIPDSVKEIESFAFSGCDKLKSVLIPDSVTILGSNSFVDCTSLVNLRLSNSLKEIETNVFNGCSALQNLILPQGLEIINGSTFINCTSLESIVIPDSVTFIGNSAFSGCTALKTIYYGGANKAEWDAIEKSWLSNSFLSASIYYYSAQKQTGNYWHYDTDGITPVKW